MTKNSYPGCTVRHVGRRKTSSVKVGAKLRKVFLSMLPQSVQTCKCLVGFGACFWKVKPPLIDLAVRVPLQGADIGIPARGYNTAMEACIRRVWLEHPPLPAKALEQLRMSLAEWEAWKQYRAEQVCMITTVSHDFRLLRGIMKNCT